MQQNVKRSSDHAPKVVQWQLPTAIGAAAVDTREMRSRASGVRARLAIRTENIGLPFFAKDAVVARLSSAAIPRVYRGHPFAVSQVFCSFRESFHI